MRTQRPHLLLFLSLLFFAFAFAFSNLYLTASAADDAESPVPGDVGDSEFIRTSCNSTLYPDVCYTSLARFANAVQQNSGQLARVAIAVSLSKVHRTAAYVSNLTRDADYTADTRATSALHDCFSNLDDAVDEIRGSLKQMRQIGVAGDGSFMFQMSNVQTWMSAALTDEETCTDGFEDVADSRLKADVCDRVAKAKKVTSNALALVNSYANKGMP